MSLISLVIVPLITILSFLFTHIVIRQAIRHHVVDKPREDRFHTKTTALMGGVAIVLAFFLSTGIVGLVPLWWQIVAVAGLASSIHFLFRKKMRAAYISSTATVLASLAGIIWQAPIEQLLGVPAPLIATEWQASANYDTSQLMWLMLGAQIIFLTGAFDDRSKSMEPKIKLFFQLLASGITATVIGGFPFLPAPLGIALIMFWSVGLMNAFNLIDNMNGLSPGVACLSAFSLGLISIFYLGDIQTGTLALILGASLLGFLPLNFPNARIFMGDSGSMLLGYLMAAIALMAYGQGTSFDANVFVPVGLIIYPIFDVTLVTINRIRSGRPVYIGGKDHSSHLLVKSGLSPAKAVLTIYAMVLISSSLIYISSLMGDMHVMLSLFAIMGLFLFLGLRLTKIHDAEYMPQMKKVSR